MIRKFIILLIFIGISITTGVIASGIYSYGWLFCNMSGYKCIKVKRGDSWENLFRDPDKRDIVMRLNRINMPIYAGMVIAVPKNMDSYDYMDFSPMPNWIDTNGKREVVVDLEKQAFGAYLENGRLVHWGPVSGGRGYCPDEESACNTPHGVFYVYSRGAPTCV